MHRLLQLSALPDDIESARKAARVLLRPDERAQLDDEQGTLEQAVALFCSLRGRKDVREALTSGRCEFEVPFALKREDLIVRGSIDCLVERPDGSVLVLEFKTGRRAAIHARQLEIYIAAAQAMFPSSAVEGRILYPET